MTTTPNDRVLAMIADIKRHIAEFNAVPAPVADPRTAESIELVREETRKLERYEAELRVWYHGATDLMRAITAINDADRSLVTVEAGRQANRLDCYDIYAMRTALKSVERRISDAYRCEAQWLAGHGVKALP